jgi:16S rRNA (cytidine1402-2'-O)-methyltransferase
MSGSGVLFVVATPIGNRGDLSLRARETLASVDLVAAEDTRHTGAFLRQLGIDCPLISFHEHNEQERVSDLIQRLLNGARIALVSDAGTPLVSDPGYRIVAAAGAAGITVTPVPGACAAIAALSVAGLPTDRFVFEGFLPPRGTKRRARLAELASESRTMVFYEAPHRLIDMMGDLADAFGKERPAALARELTKLHESVYRSSLGALVIAAGEDANMARGEAVLIVAGRPANEETSAATTALAATLLEALLPDLPLSRAVDIVGGVTGERRNVLYERALQIKAGLATNLSEKT